MSQAGNEVLVRTPGHRMYDPPAPVATEADKEREFAILSSNVYMGDWDAPAPARTADRGAVTLAELRTVDCRANQDKRLLPLPGWTRWTNFPSAALRKSADDVGLYFEVWETEAPPRRVAVVFRGTDSWKDWLSNFRWFTWLLRFVPIYQDQYHVVSQKVGEEFAARLKNEQADSGSAPLIVTTGHSLGGGLAQHFAYALPADPRVPRVSHVHAFDPSPVTGWSSVAKGLRTANAVALETDRIFEHGEILAYIRLLLSYVNPPPAVAPSVREIRFNFVRSANPLKSHSMFQLACHIVSDTGFELARAGGPQGIR
jgi:Lipase (class 3)